MEGDRATKFESVSSLSLRSTLSTELTKKVSLIERRSPSDVFLLRWWDLPLKYKLRMRKMTKRVVDGMSSENDWQEMQFLSSKGAKSERSIREETVRPCLQTTHTSIKDSRRSTSKTTNCLERRGPKTSLFFARSTRDGQCSRSVRWSRRWFSSSSHSISHFFHWMSFVVTFWSFHSNDAASSNGQTIAMMMDKSVHWGWPSQTIDERWQC